MKDITRGEIYGLVLAGCLTAMAIGAFVSKIYFEAKIKEIQTQMGIAPKAEENKEVVGETQSIYVDTTPKKDPTLLPLPPAANEWTPEELSRANSKKEETK
jgi:hypothetical protein